MTTAAVCGMTGLTSLGGEVTRWEFTELQDTPDATSMASDGNREYIACLKSAEGTFDTQVSVGGVGAQIGVTFQNDLNSYSLNIFITDIKNSVPTPDKVMFTYSFVSTGAVTVS